MVSSTKNNLKQMTDNIRYDLAFAKENATMCSEMTHFADQKDYWEGKVEALESVIDVLQKTEELVNSISEKKKNFFSFFIKDKRS